MYGIEAITLKEEFWRTEEMSRKTDFTVVVYLECRGIIDIRRI